jgi:hypothetical protein
MVLPSIGGGAAKAQPVGLLAHPSSRDTIAMHFVEISSTVNNTVGLLAREPNEHAILAHYFSHKHRWRIVRLFLWAAIA